MKPIFSRRQIALPVCLALAAGTLMAGCASNGNKKTETAEINGPAPAVAMNKSSDTATIVTHESETPVAVAEAKLLAPEQSATIQTSEKPSATGNLYPDIVIQDNSQPQEMTFQFGFDKSELSEEDKKIVMQHARFLLDNPGMIVRIEGHTDSTGPRLHNEYLSKKRAEAVASIMIAEGVSESQLEIVALADERPLADAEDAKKNRRVELEYNEVNLVKND